VGQGACDAYRRVPRDEPDPPWSTSNVWGDESIGPGRLCTPKFPVYEIYGATAAYNHQSRSLVVRDVRLRVRYEVALSEHVRLLGHPRAGAQIGARAFASTVGPRARAVRRHGTSDGRRRRRSHCALNRFYRHGLGPRALLSAYGFQPGRQRRDAADASCASS